MVERLEPVAGPGEVVVAVAVSGVNPTDWKSREGKAPGEELRHAQVVPNQDGAGTVTAVGDAAPCGWAVMPGYRCTAFPLAGTGRAHAAVADGAVGKVLIDIV